MTGKKVKRQANLRLVSLTSSSGQPESTYSLREKSELIIGRDPSGHVVLDSTIYPMVSRRHAVVRSLPASVTGEDSWLLCDLNSANGTYLNGKLIQGCQQLNGGDRFTLGSDGATFIFEYQIEHQFIQVPLPSSAAIMSAAAKQNAARIPDSVSFTQLFPIISTGKDLTKKAYLIPGILTVIFVVLMFATVGQPNAAFFNQMLVAMYLACAAYYFVYQLCGKSKPWWVLIFVAVATSLILLSPLLAAFIFIFRTILPGQLPPNIESISFPELLLRMFFGAGLMEELLKMLPVLGAYLIGRLLPNPWRDRIGIREPLDGILLGTASAVGFTLVETLGQYVPQITMNLTAEAGRGVAELAGLQLLIPRILGSVSGHMAYSGYLGYFIGLAVLKPRKKVAILSIGYLTAAGLHALWNATGVFSSLLLAVVGVLSYAFLTAAILKARALSPTREQNFATRFFE